jgi:hypothetical protein
VYDRRVVVGRGSRAKRCGPRKRGRWIAAAGTLTVIVAMLVAVAGSSAAPSSAAACSQAKAFIAGTPSQSLLSILSVLRRPAAPADALPATAKEELSRPAFFRTLGREIFVNYIRRARVISGTSYFVMPVIYTGCGALKRSEGMALEEVVNGGLTEGGGAGDAAQIEQGSAYGTGGPGGFGRTTIKMLVPDEVAAVTLHYPAGKIGGFDRHHAPAFTITTNVVGNLVIVTVPRAGNRLDHPQPMIWRAAGGTIVKTFSRL